MSDDGAPMESVGGTMPIITTIRLDAVHQETLRSLDAQAASLRAEADALGSAVTTLLGIILKQAGYEPKEGVTPFYDFRTGVLFPFGRPDASIPLPPLMFPPPPGSAEGDSASGQAQSQEE